MWLNEEIEKAERILILGHVRPDGDCVGSTLGLCNYIRDNWPEKELVVCLGDFSDDFLLLKGAGDVKHALPDLSFDLAFAVDVSAPDRLGEWEERFFQIPRRICIDHHATNSGFAQENCVDAAASAASELLYTLMDPSMVSLACAECLYLGIVHDTGVFKHSNTTRKTMEIAGALLEKGVSSSRIIDDTFYHKTFVQNRILGYALLQSTLERNGSCIMSCITWDDLQRFGARTIDLEGVIDQLRVTEGTKVAVLIHENGDGCCKISMRSNSDTDVSVVASAFGGGGHVKAAGCTIEGSAMQAKLRLMEVLEKAMK